MKTKENLFAKSDWRAIAGLCVPALLSIVVMLLYNMADLYFVGWMGQVSAVAAVSLAGPVYSLLMAMSTMLGNGACTRIAQALGRGEEETVRRCTALCFWGSLGFGAVFALVCFGAQGPILRLLGANAEMWADARSYMLVLAAGAPLLLLNHTWGSALRGEGRVTASLIGSMIGTFGNILLDPVFILGLELGVGGAAAATVISNGLAAGYYFVLSRTGRCTLELHPRYARDLAALGDLLALGLPNAVSTGLSGLAHTFSNRLLVGYGTAAVAAMGAAGKATTLVTMVQMGVCMGVQPLLAYCYGGKNWPRLRRLVYKMLGLTLTLGVVLTAVLFAGRQAAIGLFLQDVQTAALGARLLALHMLLGPFIGLYYLAANFLQAGGNAPAATLASALRQGVLLIPLLHLLEALFGLDGLAFAAVAADALSVLAAGGVGPAPLPPGGKRKDLTQPQPTKDPAAGAPATGSLCFTGSRGEDEQAHLETTTLARGALHCDSAAVQGDDFVYHGQA